jgi:hypothetical protein
MSRLRRIGGVPAALWAVLAGCLVVAGCLVFLGSAHAAVFPDVFSNTADNPDYPNAVAALSNQGVITGLADGTFSPHAPVMRQQFAKMIVKVLGLSVGGSEVCPFTDVTVGGNPMDPLYPDKYIAVCAAVNITTGKTPTSFRPYDNITRAQLLSMVVRGARYAGADLVNPTPEYYAGSSSNSHFFPNWVDTNHGLNAQIAEFNGLLNGIWPDSGDTWDPGRNATRGEVAQILWQLQQKMGVSSGTTVPTGPTTTTTPTVPHIEGTTPISFGQVISSSFQTMDQVDTYVFAASAGDKVFVRLVRGVGPTIMGLTLLDTNGRRIFEYEDFPTVETFPVAIQTSGVYTIRAYLAQGSLDVGEYCLYVQRLNNPGAAVPLTYGQTIHGSIESEAEMDTYTLSAKAGDIVDITMRHTGGTMWTGLRFYGPSGVWLIDQGQPITSEFSGVLLPVTGTYTLLAFDGWYGFRKGTYDLVVEKW